MNDEKTSREPRYYYHTYEYIYVFIWYEYEYEYDHELTLFKNQICSFVNQYVPISIIIFFHYYYYDDYVVEYMNEHTHIL